MAEVVMRHQVRECGLHTKITVSSAGTRASQPGHRPDARVQKVLSATGMSLAGIRARQVTAKELERSDYVLAMDTPNYNDLIELGSPEQHIKIRLLMSYAPELGVGEVPDPYFGNIGGFEEVLRLVDVAVSHLIREIANSLD